MTVEVIGPISQEVIRTLPLAQREEIAHHSALLSDAALHLEYGKFCVGTAGGETVRAIGEKVLPRITDTLLQRDIVLASEANFPTISPQRAMALATHAGRVAEFFANSNPEHISVFAQFATGIVGLHWDILGTRENVERGDAERHFQEVIDMYNIEYVRPLVGRHAYRAHRY